MALLTDLPTTTQAQNPDGDCVQVTFTGEAVTANDTLRLIADDVYATYQIFNLAVTVSGGSATRVDPEFHSSATPGAATLTGAMSWGTTTPGLHYAAIDGPIYPAARGSGLFLRLQPNAAATGFVVSYSIARVRGPA